MSALLDDIINLAIDGTPDCDWGFEMPDVAAWRVKKCYAEFRKHCVERHDLSEDDEESQMFLNFEEGALTLLEQK